MSILNLFKKKSITPKEILKITEIPSGIIVYNNQGSFYFKGGKRFRFVSENAKTSWSLPELNISANLLKDYPVTGVLGFRDGSLIQDISDSKIYLVSENKLRHIVDPLVLEWFDAKIIKVGEKEIKAHAVGEKLYS